MSAPPVPPGPPVPPTAGKHPAIPRKRIGSVQVTNGINGKPASRPVPPGQGGPALGTLFPNGVPKLQPRATVAGSQMKGAPNPSARPSAATTAVSTNRPSTPTQNTTTQPKSAKTALTDMEELLNNISYGALIFTEPEEPEPANPYVPALNLLESIIDALKRGEIIPPLPKLPPPRATISNPPKSTSPTTVKRTHTMADIPTKASSPSKPIPSPRSTPVSKPPNNSPSPPTLTPTPPPPRAKSPLPPPSATPTISEPEAITSTDHTCAGCSQQITAKCFKALNSYWHTEHFQCTSCKNPLTQYVEYDDKAYCEPCYNKVLLVRECVKCHLPIHEQMLVALNKNYHMKCFGCEMCNTPFPNGRYLEYQGRAVCEPCYKKAAVKKCAECGEQITGGELIQLFGKMMHNKCFKCTGCKSVFPSLQYYPVNDLPYCYDCASAMS